MASTKNNLLENLDLVFDNLNDGLLILDLKGKILKINKALLKLGDYRREDLEGKNAMKLVKMFPPRSLKKIAGSFVDAIKGVPGDRYELEAKTKTGKLKTIEVSTSLIEESGKKIGIVVTIRETTSRIDFEKRLKESEETYRALYNSSQDAIMTLAPPDWKFTSGNPATVKMFGAKDEKEFTSLGPWQVSPKKQPDGKPSDKKAQAMIVRAMKEGSSFFEWTHKRLNGQDFPAIVLLSKIKIKGKELLQATVRDISEAKKAEIILKEKMEELEKVNQLMVGRELKMVELKKEIQNLKKGISVQEEKKTWAEKFQQAIDLEEGIIKKYKNTYVDAVNKSSLSVLKKIKAKKLLNILVEESIGHENHFKELIQRENGKQ